MTKSGRDPWRTEYGVQPFQLVKRVLTVEQVRMAGGRDQALRLGERLASDRTGVLVFSRRSAPSLGEYEEPKVIATHGKVPLEVLEAMPAELRNAAAA